MKLSILIVLISFLGACSTTHSKPSNTARQPSSQDNIAVHSLPTADIKSILVFNGDTQCTKGAEIKPGIRSKLLNPNAKPAHSYNCATTAPVSVAISSSSLGLNNSYSGMHTLVFQGMTSTKDLTSESERQKLHTENMAQIKTYFDDIAAGCMGSSAIMTLSEKGDLINLEGSIYFGKARCNVHKTLTAGSNTVVSYYSSAVDKVKQIPADVKNHAEQVAASADALQKQSREYVAQKLKEMSEGISP